MVTLLVKSWDLWLRNFFQTGLHTDLFAAIPASPSCDSAAGVEIRRPQTLNHHHTLHKRPRARNSIKLREELRRGSGRSYWPFFVAQISQLGMGQNLTKTWDGHLSKFLAFRFAIHRMLPKGFLKLHFVLKYRMTMPWSGGHRWSKHCQQVSQHIQSPRLDGSDFWRPPCPPG